MDLLKNNSKYIQINLSEIINAIGEDGAKSSLLFHAQIRMLRIF